MAAASPWLAIARLLTPTFGPFGLDLYWEKNETEAVLTSHAEVILEGLAVEDLGFKYVIKIIKRSCLNLTTVILLVTALLSRPRDRLRDFYFKEWKEVQAQLTHEVACR
jgi:hypothetical protein